MEYYVYEWIRHDTNEPFYVGKGKNNRDIEFKKNKYFMNIINYCERNNIPVSVCRIEEGLTEKEAFQTECWVIHDYMFNFGFKLANLNFGGEGGNSFLLMSEEDKAKYILKMRKSLIGKNKGRKVTEKQKKIQSLKMKNRFKGENNPMYGKSIFDFMTPDKIESWKRNVSKAKKGKTVLSEESKKKISKAHIGYKHSLEARQKMSRNRMGEKNHKFGTHMSEEEKLFLRSFHIKKTKLTLNGQSKIFESRNDCYYYLRDKYGISMYLVKKLLKTGENYNPTKKKYKVLKDMTIQYI